MSRSLRQESCNDERVRHSLDEEEQEVNSLSCAGPNRISSQLRIWKNTGYADHGLILA